MFSYASKFISMWSKIDEFYFFEMNTKFISLNVLKISAISRVRSTSVIADIFNTRGEIFLVLTEKKINFL